MKQAKQKRSWIKILLIILSGIIIITSVALLLLPRPYFATGYASLPIITAYVATRNEAYTMDSENTIKPDFAKFYATMKPTWHSNVTEKLTWLGTFAHLTQAPAWSPSFFKEQMLTLAKQRKADGYDGDQIVKVTPTAESKIVVFGNIQGALHSLTRCLNQLKQLGIINDELVITNPNYFIIFTGDVVSRSPFTMPTLSLVCRLLEKNPKQVIYLRGNHESKNYWQEHTLKTELELFAWHLGKGETPLAEEVNAFFNTLPVAAYINLNNEDNTHFIRISDVGRAESDRLQENTFGTFLTAKSDKALTLHALDKKDGQSAPVMVKVIFRGEKKRESYQPHDGLRLLQPDMDSTAWTILSCPTIGYQKAIKFFHDAFGLITPGKTEDDWTITLYNHDVRTKDAFKATSFNLLSGEDTSSGKKPVSPTEESQAKEIKEEKQPIANKKTGTINQAPAEQNALIDDEPSAFKQVE